MEVEVLHKKKTLTPKLRFKGFDGNWEKAKLEDVGKIRMCKRIFSYETKESGEIPFYKIGTFGKEADAFITKELYLDFKARFSFPKVGDILMSASGTLGRTVIYDGSPAYFQDSNIVWIDNDEEFITNSFLFYIYQIVKYNSEGGTIQRLYNGIINAAKFAKPTLPEQQKIASFLSAVDEKIQQLTRKKELLTEYKKGVMQQLFSGKLRFQDENGKAFPKWEDKKIKDFILDKKGAMKIGPFGSQLKKTTFVGDGFKVYGQENIFISDFDFGDRYITEAHFNTLKTNELHPGDFVISTMGTIGKCCLVPQSIKRGIMDSHMIRLQLDQTKILPELLGQIFSSYYLQKQVKRFSVGGIMDGLSMGIINKLKFTIPVNIQEQKKIATYLSNLDIKIENVTKQILQTQIFKKGLLQQMFA